MTSVRGNMKPRHDVVFSAGPKLPLTIADVFVEVGLARSTNDVRLACGMGCAWVDSEKLRDWNALVDPVTLKGRTLRFINMKHLCMAEMDLRMRSGGFFLVELLSTSPKQNAGPEKLISFGYSS